MLALAQTANNPTPVLGRRIVGWGATGSGKTTFARNLGDLLGLEVIELDAIRHARSWDSTDWDDFRDQLTTLLSNSANGWVCDGSYSQISATYLSRADTLIWLHLPWRVSFWRLLKRTIRRARTGEFLYTKAGPRESWRLSFASKRSILWWSISHHRTGIKTVRERLSNLPESVPVYEFRSAREMNALLKELRPELSR